MDARIEATRRRLREAVLMLAARKDIGTVTVAELARAAGIDRSTFYGHASSPTELLLGVLREDLDPLRVEADASLDGAPETVAEIGRGLNARLIDHVERYEAVYADRDGGQPSSALHTVLSDHVRASLELVFRHLDSAAGTAAARVEPEYLAAFLAHGIVGAVSVWLAETAPRDRARLEAVLDIVYSAWIVPAAGRRGSPHAFPGLAGETSVPTPDPAESTPKKKKREAS